MEVQTKVGRFAMFMSKETKGFVFSTKRMEVCLLPEM